MPKNKLTPYLACSIAEGFADFEPTQEQIIEAWQYISDTGLWKYLQGFYGRTVASLKEDGIIK